MFRERHRFRFKIQRFSTTRFLKTKHKRNEMNEEIESILKELGVKSPSTTSSAKLHEDFRSTCRSLIGVPDVTEKELMEALEDLEDLDDEEEDDDTPSFDLDEENDLCNAAASGNLELVKKLLREGSNPNEIRESNDKKTMTPLCAAAAAGSVAIIRTLLEHGADPYVATMPYGNTCLHYASRLNRVDIVRELLSKGVQSLPNHAGLTPLADHLLHCGEDTEIYKLLSNAASSSSSSSPSSSSSSSTQHKTITRGEILVDLSKCLSPVGHSTSPVYVGTHIPTNSNVAVKIVPVHLWDEVSAEIRAISALKTHPRLSQIVHVEKCSMNTLIATPLCNAGDLSQASVKLFQRDDFVSKVAPNLCRHVTEGLEYLHASRFAHRDLKPSNILIHQEKDGTFSARLADFGYALPLGGSGNSSDFLQLRIVVSGQHGTTGFKPLELLLAMRSKGGIVMNNAALIRADIFGLGCILFYILSKGKHPFGDDVMSREAKILDRSNVLWYDKIPQSTKLLLNSTLLHDAKKRPSSKVVLSALIKLFFSS